MCDVGILGARGDLRFRAAHDTKWRAPTMEGGNYDDEAEAAEAEDDGRLCRLG
jgi:hypothetical protein